MATKMWVGAGGKIYMDLGLGIGAEVMGVDPDGTVTAKDPITGMTMPRRDKLTPAEMSGWNDLRKQAEVTYFGSEEAAAKAHQQIGDTKGAAGLTPQGPSAEQQSLDANDVTMRQLDEFIAELRNPINADSNDPYVQSIVRGAHSQATLQASGRGIEGGLSMAATQQNVGSALGQLEGQRIDRLQRAMGLRSQHGLATEQLANQARSLQEQQYQFDAQMGMAGQGQSGLGAGLGLLGGLALPAIGSALFPQYSAELFKNLPNFMQGGVAAGQGFESSLAGPYRPPSRSSYRGGGYRGA